MTAAALRRRLGRVERRLPRSTAGAGAGPYDPVLHDWLSIEERERLEAHFVAAIEAENTGRDDLEAEAMIVAGYARAAVRRANGWPPMWWEIDPGRTTQPRPPDF